MNKERQRILLSHVWMLQSSDKEQANVYKEFPKLDAVLILTANSDLVLVLVFWITHHLVLAIF